MSIGFFVAVIVLLLDWEDRTTMADVFFYYKAVNIRES